jgi:hypothetical protein
MTANTEVKPTEYDLNRLLRWAAIPALLYAAVILAGLLLHPSAPGIFVSGASLAGRWLSALNGIFTIGVALFVMRRVPGNACGPLLLLWGVGVLGWSLPINWGITSLSAAMSVIYQFYFFGVAFSALVCLLYVFPTGRVEPAWMTRPLMAAVVVIVFLGAVTAMIVNPADIYGAGVDTNPVYSRTLAGYETQLGTLTLMVPLVMMLGAVISLGWRFRHAATHERQQVKFLVFGFAVLVVEAMAVVLITGIETPDNPTSRQLWFSILSFMAWQALPAVIIAVTIARYKLWDIDLIIRRTVSYTILTGILALIYFGSIVILQRLLAPLTGDSDVATILSTLLIAALVLPLRRRIQDLIDRRFFRRKYDAQKTLEQFAHTARDETDLEKLTAELLRVIQETMEPEHVSIWLKPTAEHRSIMAGSQKPAEL